MAYDTGTGTWSMYFDGSDVGIGSTDVIAFTILSDGSILMSFHSSTFNVPGVGTIEDSDIVRFYPTSTGTTTAGTFEWYFDGSDVGLTTNGEDIDAIAISPEGDLIISTLGSYNIGGASGRDEDLLRFVPTSLGSTTSGVFHSYFDGSDVGLNNSSSEDVYGAWIDPANNDVYLTTAGNFSVTGVSGNGADIFTCTPGSLGFTTSCSFSMFWDGSANGFGGEVVDDFFIQRP